MKSPLELDCKLYSKKILRKPQGGLVLFFALIALVVMSLAAVGLIRSVDTSNLIAGNLAFKQSATASADHGVDAAMKGLTTILTSNPLAINADIPTEGYYATIGNLALFEEATWSDANSKLATGDGIVDGADSSGNIIRFVIERMCRSTVLPVDEKNCLFGAPVTGSNDKDVKNYGGAGGAPTIGKSLMYRVTARVVGPKDTVSFVQVYVY